MIRKEFNTSDDLARWIADLATEYLTTHSFPTGEVRAAIDQYLKQGKLEELKTATTKNFDGLLGTYDFDGIARSVFDRIAELQADTNTHEEGR